MDESLFKTDKRKIYPGSRGNTIVYLIFCSDFIALRAISLNGRAPLCMREVLVIDIKVLNYFSAVKQSFFFLQLRACA